MSETPEEQRKRHQELYERQIRIPDLFGCEDGCDYHYVYKEDLEKLKKWCEEQLKNE